MFPLQAFCGHSLSDATPAARLRTALAVLHRERAVRLWARRDLPAGAERNSMIAVQLDGAALVLLLISARFLASDLCYFRIMQRALNNRREGRQVVVPIILRPCDWTSTPLGDLQALPRDRYLRVREVSKWSQPDDAWQNVTDELRVLILDAFGPWRPASTSASKTVSSDLSLRQVPDLCGRWMLIISGEATRMDFAKREQILALLREIGHDHRLILLRVEEGSTQLVFFGTRLSFELIHQRYIKGELGSALNSIVPCEVREVMWGGPRWQKRVSESTGASPFLDGLPFTTDVIRRPKGLSEARVTASACLHWLPLSCPFTATSCRQLISVFASRMKLVLPAVHVSTALQVDPNPFVAPASEVRILGVCVYLSAEEWSKALLRKAAREMDVLAVNMSASWFWGDR